MHQSKSDLTYYQHFGLKEDIAIDLFSHFITQGLHKGLCVSCGKHVAPEPLMDSTLATYKEYCYDDNQKAYVMYTLGLTLTAIDIWEFFTRECKKEDINDTYDAVHAYMVDYTQQLSAPFN